MVGRGASPESTVLAEDSDAIQPYNRTQVSSAFNAAVGFVLAAEGGMTVVGSVTTNFGISSTSFPMVDIAGLTSAEATDIYRASYWLPIKGDALPSAVALVVFDGAVNQGVATAVRILQAAVGTTQDGIVGPLTIAAAGAMTTRGLIAEICARRAVAYADDNMALYGLGWMRRLMRAQAAALALL